MTGEQPTTSVRTEAGGDGPGLSVTGGPGHSDGAHHDLGRGVMPAARALLTRDFLRYLGPGFIVTAGFIDPGNWATNIAGGSQFGYQLLWVVSLATLMLIIFQNLAARLGIVSGHSMAYNVRARFSHPWAAVFGSTIVAACVATDVAEILGGALGFNLLFGLPLWLGGLLTVIIKMALIVAGRYHQIERLIMALIGVIAICYLIELLIVHPHWGQTAVGTFVPRLGGGSIVVAMGILGAVLMPHNIYLHSNTILSRDWSAIDTQERARLMTYEFADTTLAMVAGWLVNLAMIVVAAAVFHAHGLTVTSIEQASATLAPLVGNLARLLFGIALLLAGVSSSITASMAEANVIAGLLGRPEDPQTWFYRLSLFVTAVPALAVVATQTDSFRVLVLSQVVLSIQLPFTIVPLLILTSDRRLMGSHASGPRERIVAWGAGAIVIALNVLLLYYVVRGGA